jgi:hypothetical protein
MIRLKSNRLGMACMSAVLLFGHSHLNGATDESATATPEPTGVEKDGGENAPDTEKASPQAKSGLKVPWPTGDKPPIVRRPLPTAYEALELIMSESELQTLFGQSSFDPMDPALIKILFRYPLLGLDDIERFAKENRAVTFTELAESPESQLGKVFHFRGRVKKVVRADLLPRVAEGYDFDHFYIVEMEIDKSLPPLLICARSVPKAWQGDDEEIDELASCYGMLTQANELEDGARQLVATVDRVAWHPDRINKSAGIGENQLLLSKLGMDYGLFDSVRVSNGKSTIEPECFYQLLSVLERTSTEELSKQTARFDLAQLLGDPKTQHGNLIMVEGSARRIQKIDISGSYFDQRLGIDHYYEVDVFIPLKRPVKLSHGPGEPIVYKTNFPVTVDVLRLPEGLGEGESLNQRIRIPCVYFKLWAYKSQYVNQHNPHQHQLSPLLLGIEPEIVETDTSINPYVAAAALSLFALALGGLWFGLWRTSRKDDEFERNQVERQFQVEKGKSLNTMGIEAEDGPDFSKLD